jgi:hypothetical protein
LVSASNATSSSATSARAQHVQAGARHQPEFAGDRLKPERRVALAEQAQDRGGARDGGGLGRLDRFRKVAVGAGGGKLLVGRSGHPGCIAGEAIAFNI